MKFPKTLLSAVVLVIGTGVASGFAEEREVNNIWWNLDDNDGGQTVCVAENYNDYPVDAVFNVFPAAFDPDGNPMPNTATITMTPYVEYKLYRWDNVAGPGPQCALLSYSAPAH
jgi:hypothetical protein